MFTSNDSSFKYTYQPAVVLFSEKIREEKPDIINSHELVVFIGDMAALLSGKIPLVLTYHAEIMKRKGLYYLLDAIKALSEVKLCIVGEKGDFTDERIISVSIQFYPLIFSESLKESYVKSF